MQFQHGEKGLCLLTAFWPDGKPLLTSHWPPLAYLHACSVLCGSCGQLWKSGKLRATFWNLSAVEQPTYLLPVDEWEGIALSHKDSPREGSVSSMKRGTFQCHTKSQMENGSCQRQPEGLFSLRSWNADTSIAAAWRWRPWKTVSKGASKWQRSTNNEEGAKRTVSYTQECDYLTFWFNEKINSFGAKRGFEASLWHFTAQIAE